MGSPYSHHSLIEWGSGDAALVFLHYFGGAASSWRWVAERLQEDYRCVAIDLPGFGDAPLTDELSLSAYAAAVKSVIAALDLQSYTLVGHSMGGKIALQIAADSPGEALEGVILVAPSPATQEPMPAEEKQRMLKNHPDADNAKTTISQAAHQPLAAEQHALAVKTHVAPDSRAWHWWLQQGMEHSIADQMHQIRVPVTVIASEDDPVIPYGVIQTDVVELIPGAQLITAQSVGHLLPLEKPGYVAEQIRQIVPQE